MQEHMSNMLTIEPYCLKKEDKEKMMREDLLELTRHHYSNCDQYRRILDKLQYDESKIKSIYDLPMIPIRLFKEQDLLSVDKTLITKTMTSSGTSGQQVSKIYLDSDNARNQTKVLTNIINSYIGNERQPLLILDTPLVKKDRAMFSARGAGIIGFTMFGRKVKYALDENMNLDIEGIKEFVNQYNDQKIIIFGYTYIIWQYCIQALQKEDNCLNINDGILFHVGGWKKLKDQRVDDHIYNQFIRNTMGNIKVYNYYGMAEQLGSIYVECENGHMHCSNFSDVIIRRSKDFSVADIGEKGLMEIVSLLPSSYPGHVILTEDEGEILGEDDCPCGRLGKYFKIHGRIKNAEVRGCSDTFEESRRK